MNNSILGAAVRIAVLEDDKDQVELMQSWFRDAGHEYQACGSGNEFKTVLKRETFDLLVVVPVTISGISARPTLAV
jgi:DNA-binding response OmpR family regulator